MVTLSFDGRPDDADLTALVEAVIGIATKDLPTEIVQREVSIFRAIHGCTSNHDESPAWFANRFLIARIKILNPNRRIGFFS